MAKKVQRASAVVDKFVLESKARSEAVWKESTKRLITEVQTPVAKGGKMRVDTGFLRASGQASLTGMPTGPARPATDQPGAYANVPNLTIVTIARASLGGKIWFGWTANYARAREYHDGFLRSGVGKWSQIVAEVVRELKQRTNNK